MGRGPPPQRQNVGGRHAILRERARLLLCVCARVGYLLTEGFALIASSAWVGVGGAGSVILSPRSPSCYFKS